MGFDLDVTVPALTVFLQGILSFFSPCVLPIIPLYMGYLSGGTHMVDGKQVFNKKKVIINTIFFILGVSFAFFILGLGFSALGQFFSKNQMLFSRIGGILVILLGLMQLGIFDNPQATIRLPIKVDVLKLNPITALIMGFTFSFAWTPCIGPALSTVLIMIASSSGTGIILMGVYTIGFTLPFLFVGIFTTTCLEFFKKHRNLLRYTVKFGALIMILMGIMMFTGTMNNITQYLSSISLNQDLDNSEQQDNATEDDEPYSSEDDEPYNSNENQESLQALDFELLDQFGNTHKLSDYKGKVVFLNIWATWCPPCKAEMPDIQRLYENYGENQQDVIILGVAFPNDENTYTQDVSNQEIISFLEQNNYTYPTVMDLSGELLFYYGISSFPTTFMIDVDGNIFGYVPGMLSYDIMENIIEQTKNS